MKIDIGAYNEHYHQAGKFIDKFQEGIKLIPFDSRNASAYDKIQTPANRRRCF